MSDESTVSRRGFMKEGAAAAASLMIVPRHVLGGTGQVAPSDQVGVALIGAGGQGRSNLHKLFEEPDARIVAVADPAAHFGLERFYYQGSAGRLPIKAEIEEHHGAGTPGYRCAAYEDFREMLERETSVDAVLCATPDHLHAYVSVLAMRAGKHVYCEKPLTHDIWEARYVARVAQETGVATQMGNQGHASDTMREVVELLQSGAIGSVREVHAWVGATRWNPGLTGRPEDTPPVPAGLNWDLWLGPREERPFHPAYFPVRWRDFWAFGGSHIADFGCHQLDSSCWAFDLADPATIEFHPAGGMNEEIAPYGCIGEYRFPARGGRPPLTLRWYDGGLRPIVSKDLLGEATLPDRGVLFVGDRGAVLTPSAADAPQLLPAASFRGHTKPPATIPRSKGHHREWLDACKGGPPAGSHFGYAARLTEVVLLGVLALRLGQRVEWNAKKMEAAGASEAERIIREPRRDGWKID